LVYHSLPRTQTTLI